MVKGKLFEIARENAKYNICPGCGEKKPAEEFIKNKYCKKCPHLDEIREKYRKSDKQEKFTTQQEIEDINFDDFFENLL